MITAIPCAKLYWQGVGGGQTQVHTDLTQGASVSLSDFLTDASTYFDMVGVRQAAASWKTPPGKPYMQLTQAASGQYTLTPLGFAYCCDTFNVADIVAGNSVRSTPSSSSTFTMRLGWVNNPSGAWTVQYNTQVGGSDAGGGFNIRDNVNFDNGSNLDIATGLFLGRYWTQTIVGAPAAPALPQGFGKAYCMDLKSFILATIAQYDAPGAEMNYSVYKAKQSASAGAPMTWVVYKGTTPCYNICCGDALNWNAYATTFLDEPGTSSADSQDAQNNQAVSGNGTGSVGSQTNLAGQPGASSQSGLGTNGQGGATGDSNLSSSVASSGANDTSEIAIVVGALLAVLLISGDI